MAELNQRIFNLSNRFVIGFIDVLKHGKCADFTDDSHEEPVDVLGVVSDEEELVAQLREVGFDALAYLSEYGWERLGILLVGACRGIEPDVGRLKQVELYLGAEISLVANDAAVVVLQLDVV